MSDSYQILYYPEPDNKAHYGIVSKTFDRVEKCFVYLINCHNIDFVEPLNDNGLIYQITLSNSRSLFIRKIVNQEPNNS